MTLYELKNEYLEVLNMVDEVDIETLTGTLEAIEGEIEVKADGYVKLIKQLDAEARAFEAEAKLFEAKQKSRENLKANLIKRMYDAMNATGLTEIPNDLFTIKIQRNGGVAPLMFVEGKDVPEEYQIIKTEANNAKIREALKNGELDFAYLGERGTHLVIK